MAEPNHINLLELVTSILQEKSYTDISIELNVAVGTIKRWVELENVPKQYCFDLMRIAKMDIDYSKFTFKDKDQFYTPQKTAEYCYSKFLHILTEYKDSEGKYYYIEPSAGNGNFLKIFPENRRMGLDIEPKNDEIIKTDYLSWTPQDKYKNSDNKIGYVVFGNPPFGLRGQLALKFINHSNKFADYVCFILPQLFESDGKGVPRKRVKGFNLLHSEKLYTDFQEPTGKKIKVECIFQIWSKYHKNSLYDIKNIDEKVIKIYSLSDGGTPSTTRNKKMIDKCDIYIPSTCFGKENMRYYNNCTELPGKKGYGIVFKTNKEILIKKFREIEWNKIAFLSTNSAYNIRSSQIASQFLD